MPLGYRKEWIKNEIEENVNKFQLVRTIRMEIRLNQTAIYNISQQNVKHDNHKTMYMITKRAAYISDVTKKRYPRIKLD